MTCVRHLAISSRRSKATAEANSVFGSTGSGASVSAGRRTDRKASRSWTIIERGDMARIRTHPGEILREEFLVPLGLSARALAKALGVPANRITEIMRGERDVSADTAIRLARYFRTDPRFWLNLQAAHDISKAQLENDYSKVRPGTAA